MTFSIIFPQVAVLEIGLKSDNDLGGFSLGIAIISAFLKAFGKIPVCIAQLIISQKGVENSAANSCSNLLGRSPGPRDFLQLFEDFSLLF